ncbi:hypothetical protein C2E23DRAFT_856400 [Lenzites betulinus]|nr:hypothetical protein C2E23DRAFT_856400 [Lenzites betulinus]
MLHSPTTLEAISDGMTFVFAVAADEVATRDGNLHKESGVRKKSSGGATNEKDTFDFKMLHDIGNALDLREMLAKHVQQGDFCEGLGVKSTHFDNFLTKSNHMLGLDDNEQAGVHVQLKEVMLKEDLSMCAVTKVVIDKEGPKPSGGQN